MFPICNSQITCWILSLIHIKFRTKASAASSIVPHSRSAVFLSGAHDQSSPTRGGQLRHHFRRCPPFWQSHHCPLPFDRTIFLYILTLTVVWIAAMETLVDRAGEGERILVSDLDPWPLRFCESQGSSPSPQLCLLLLLVHSATWRFPQGWRRTPSTTRPATPRPRNTRYGQSLMSNFKNNYCISNALYFQGCSLESVGESLLILS